MKKIKHIAKLAAWCVSMGLIYTIFAGGLWLIPGTLAAVWIIGSTIATAIDESR